MKENRKLILSGLMVLSLAACSEQTQTSSEPIIVEKEIQAPEAIATDVNTETVELDQTNDNGVVEVATDGSNAQIQSITDTEQKIELVAEINESANELVVDQNSLSDSTVDKEIRPEPEKVVAVKDVTPALNEQTAAVNANSTPDAEPEVVVEEEPAFVPLNGSWVKKSQSIQGQWRIEQREGTAYLVLGDDFKTRRAPDLKFVLSNLSVDEVSNKNAMQGAKLVSQLESSKGAQAYKLPDDYTSYQSLLLHCEKYTKLWGAARLK